MTTLCSNVLLCSHSVRSDKPWMSEARLALQETWSDFSDMALVLVVNELLSWPLPLRQAEQRQQGILQMQTMLYLSLMGWTMLHQWWVGKRHLCFLSSKNVLLLIVQPLTERQILKRGVSLRVRLCVTLTEEDDRLRSLVHCFTWPVSTEM